MEWNRKIIEIDMEIARAREQIRELEAKLRRLSEERQVQLQQLHETPAHDRPSQG